MNTVRHPTCPKCGAPLPVDAPKGLCPRCLAAMNLAAETVLTETDVLAAQPPLSPAELAPHFPQLEIIECLGRGGMGVVYKARQRSLNRVVALKLLAPERVSDAKFAQRFTHEAQALAALNHPSIVTIYDFGQAGGFYFLLMEFVDGVNLRQAMKAGRFTPDQALAVVPPVCEALQYAHEHGIVHRDIKPENLLLDKDGRVKIADFGIAKMLGADGPDVGVVESQPLGTPQYMAPEQKEHHRADHRADIYSLGVVLYEMLTGELPGAKLQPPSRKVLIDVRLDQIVLRALEVKPELRYQTAGEMRTQVETIVQTPAADQGSAAPLPSWFTWSPRQPPLMREICAHLTVAEQAEVTKRGLLFGIWNAATFFAPFFCIMFLPRPLGWIFGIAAFAVGLSFYPMWNRIQREFLCSTEWARQQGLKPEQLKRSALAPSTSVASPGMLGTCAGVLVCVLIVGGTAVVTSLLPRMYRSTALILVSSEATSPINTLPQLQSRTVLNQVATQLDLANQLAPRYAAGDRTEEALYRWLKRHLEIRLRNAGTVFEVSYFSEDPDEAALFANKIVEVFCAQPFGKGTRLLKTAEPAARPIRPNRLLNMLLGLGVGILVGVIVGLLVGLISARRAKRRQPPRVRVPQNPSLAPVSLLCAALLMFLMAGLGFAWLKLRGGGPTPTATAPPEPPIARPQELHPQTDVRPQSSIPTAIDFKVLRVENPPGTRNILLHFERDTNFGLAIEVSQDVMPSPDRKVPEPGHVDWQRKTWVGLNTSPVLNWTLPAEFSETEARDVAREMQRKWKGDHPLPDGAVPEFANVKHRDGWTYILMARVLREPGAPRPPPPGNAVLLGESVGIVPAGAVVIVEWERAVKDISLSPLGAPLTFKVADGRPGKLRFRWFTYDTKNPLMAGRWFLDIHDEYTGIIFHRLEDDFGQPVKFLSPIFKPEKLQTFTLGPQAAAFSLHKIIHAEPVAPPGQPITQWWDVIMSIVPNPLGKPSPVPAFQLPTPPDSGSTWRYLEQETK